MASILLLLVALTFVPSYCLEQTSTYLVSMPSDMEVGKEQKICMTLYNLYRVDVHYSLICGKNKYFYQRHKYRRGQGGCITFTIPVKYADISNTLKVSLIGSKGFRVHDEQVFTPKSLKRNTYIQTDKPVYKPGQKVNIRILTVDSELMPVLEKISRIRIVTPDDVIVKQWLDISNKNGLITLEYQLASEPSLGAWSILVDMDGSETRAKFEIKEYVLPKFSITIKPPARVNEKTETIDGEVCAKYTYGQPVKGRIMVDTCIRGLYQTYENGKKPCAVIHGEMTGCFNYSFSVRVLRPSFQNRYNYLQLSTHVAILDEATGVILNETQDGPKISKYAVKIDVRSHSRKFFKPLLPFEFRALVTTEDGKPAPKQVVTMWCDEISFREKMVTDNKGFVTYFFPRIVTEKPKIVFKVLADENENQTPVTYEATQWFSPSDTYLEIQPISKLVKTGITPITVYLTRPPAKKFRAVVQVSSRGRIVYQSQNKYRVRKNPDGSYRTSPAWCRNQKSCITNKKFSPDVPSFTVFLDVTCAMSPEAQVLIYYLNEAKGEVIADTERIKVEQCFNNKVGLSFSPSKEYPGYPTTLSLTAAPKSVCGIGVVDKSVYILGGKNQISVQQLYSILNSYNAQPSWQETDRADEESYCTEWLNRTGLVNSNEVSPPHSPYYRLYNTYEHKSDYVDSHIAFKMANLRLSGGLQLNWRPCRKVHTFRYSRYKRSLGRVIDGWQSDQGYEASGDESVDTEDEELDPKKKTAAVRQDFPETWLWDIEIVGDSGTLNLNKTLPGTITEWVGSAVCANSVAGVGVSDSASVTAFQPFFISFNLPYAAIRGEHIPITVTVFNYHTECMEIELRLNESSEFELVNPDRVTWMCICGNEAKRHDFVIIPKTLGFINITAAAKSIPGDSQCPKVTSSGDYVGIRDAVIRKLLVEPEGDEKEYTYSSLVCSDFYDSVDLPLFPDQVPDSGRGVISIIGDLMGPSFTNIGSLLRVPYGCGEQNMINFAPNVFIMRYLKAVNKLTPEINATIDKFLNSGYQRELQYRRQDASYSAFGNSDSSGSTWLTAFVIKSFSEARPFLAIDEKVILTARIWLKSKQSSNGCFKEVGRVIHSSMRGGVDGANSIITLTAYVLSALLIAGVPKQDPSIMNALNCIVSGGDIKDTYTLATAAYATALHDTNGRIHIMLQRQLESRAHRNGSFMHWEAKKEVRDSYSYRQRASSLNVETTAYALLTYLQEDDMESAINIVKWLESQRNPEGGFASTQDTVVALDALAEYSRRIHHGGLKMSMRVKGDGINANFIAADHNRMVMQTQELKVPNEISVSGIGSGCALFKATVRYNTYSLKDRDLAFTLTSTVSHPDPTRPTCSRRAIRICTKYVRGGSSGMAIVNAKMVTGWVVDIDSLEPLKVDPKLELKKVEVDEKRPDNIHFYFDELNSSEKCFTFEVNQEIKVENTKAAVIQVYDYYDTELVTKMFYSINDSCASSSPKPSPGVVSPKPRAKPKTPGLGVKEEDIDTGMDIDKGEEEVEDGSGVLDRINPKYLADGLVPSDNSLPVGNLFDIVEEVDMDKETDMGTGGDNMYEVKARLGSTAILNCPLRAKYQDTPERQYKLAWIDEEQVVLAVLGNKIVSNDRLSVVESVNLRIDNVTVEDSGKYMCQVNTVPVETVTVTLKAQDAPRVVSVTEDLMVDAGRDVVLVCNVTGVPKPRVTWYRLQAGSVRRRQGKGEVLIVNSLQESAIFKCVVSNGVPPDVSREVNITVKKMASREDEIIPTFLTTSKRVTVMERETAILPCLVTNLGIREVTWRHQGDGKILSVGDIVMTSDARFAVDRSSNVSGVGSWNLAISDSRQSDSGVYECKVTGNAKRSVNITLVVSADKENENVPPFILPTTITHVGVRQGDTARLQIQLMASPPIIPRWSKRGRQLNAGFDAKYSFNTIVVDHNSYVVELLISNVGSDDFDDYRCEIDNGFGIVSGVVTIFEILTTTVEPTTVTTERPFIPVGCPVCETKLSDSQVAYAFCKAQTAFKVLGLRIRKSQIRVKILTNFRSAKRVKVRRVVRLVVDGNCKCNIISSLRPGKFIGLFMHRELDFSSKPREIIIGSETVVSLLPRPFERKLNVERKKCPREDA